MAKNQSSEEVPKELNFNELMNELMDGTGFVRLDTGSLMNNRPKIRTPLWAINCIFGGGVPMGIIAESSGPPSSGKSTEAYQKAGIFQKQYPSGIVVILDNEASTDDVRMTYMGVDTSKVLRLPATSLEGGFRNLFSILNKLIKLPAEQIPPVYVIWDTITTGGTDAGANAAASGNSVMNAGGMMERARVLKENLGALFPYIEKINMYLVLLNQVSTQGIGSYHPSVGSGGGYGLKHNCHIHFEFDEGRDYFEEGFIAGTQSALNLGKNKLTPKFYNIPVIIDAREGGVIDEYSSFMSYINETLQMIPKGGAYYYLDKFFNDVVLVAYPEFKWVCEPYMKSWHWSKFIDAARTDSNLHKLLQIILIDKVCSIYKHLAEITRSYKEELYKEIVDPASVTTDEAINGINTLNQAIDSSKSDTLGINEEDK